MHPPAPILHVQPPTGDIVVLSDLHLSEAWAWEKRSRRVVTIHDMHDVAGSFLSNLADRWRGTTDEHLLVVNGDLFDFDCVRRLPASDCDFRTWRRVLDGVGHAHTSEAQLRRDIHDHERTDGFDPVEHKSVWKLIVAFQDNRPVFEPLARLAADRARIVVLRGNHDTELYWPAVQRAFRFLLAECRGGRLTEHQKSRFDRIVVAPHAVRVGQHLYFEHGHRFERVSYAWPDIRPEAPEVLELSLGSWYMRTSYSPAQPVIREPGLLGRCWAKLVEELVAALYPAALGVAIVLPSGLVGKLGWFVSDAERYRTRTRRRKRNWRQALRDIVLPPTLHIDWLRRLGSRWLAEEAAHALRALEGVRIVLLGHTHWPYRGRFHSDGLLLNSGSWLPAYDTGPAERGPGAPFTFIHLKRREHDWTPRILRWDPASRRWRRHVG
jgi:UDP-2,3-diacylglucosamine pyrophosphatase LpxH